jgi:hypothetical protein
MLIGLNTNLRHPHSGAPAERTCPASYKALTQKSQLIHRVVHTIHRPPVDITVDKGTPRNSEKAQQNQHFKYHRRAASPYSAVNKPFIAALRPKSPASASTNPIVTPSWNMHRSGAACSLNVTGIGICLSSQHHTVAAFAQFSSHTEPVPLTHPEGGTIVKPRPLECSLAREPRVFPGIS